MKTESKMTIALTALAFGASTMLTGPALAENHVKKMDDTQQTEGAAPADNSMTEDANKDAAATDDSMKDASTENMDKSSSADAVIFLTYDMEMQLTADEIVGMKVDGTNGERIGDVNQVVLSTDGEALGIIVGVGGFLGIGEKDVAISFDRVQFTKDDGMAEHKIVLNATKEELEAAPAYERNS